MYQFTEDCLIGIQEIDDEHRRLFAMVNDAFALLQNRSDAPLLAKSMLNGLKEYAATHVAHEEAYMEQINDPELPRQKKEHSAFITKVNSIDISTLNTDTAYDTIKDLLEFLVRWLYRHILSSDMMIGKISPVKKESGTSDDPFAFTDIYRTGIELVDEEHKRLFEIIRETKELIYSDLLHDKYDEIIHIIDELKDYTEVHFQDEEAYMKKINYPGLDAQVRAHNAFIERLVEIDLSDLDDMDDHQQEYLKELISFLLAWLSNHILKMDKQIGAFAGK